MTNYDQPSSIFSRKKHHNDPLSQKEIHYHSQQLRKLLQTTCNQPLLTSTNIWEPTLSNTMSVTTHYHLQGLTTTKNKNHNHHMQDQYYKTICNDPIAPRNLRQQVAIIHCYPRLPKKCHNNWLSPTTYSMKPILLLSVGFQTNRFQKITSVRRVQLSIAVTTVWLNGSILLLCEDLS